MPRPPTRTGLIVIRAWLEKSTPALRVDVRFSVDVAQGFDQTASFAHIDGVCVEVRRCLEQFSAPWSPDGWGRNAP